MQAPDSLQALLPKPSVGARAILLWGKRWYDSLAYQYAIFLGAAFAHFHGRIASFSI